MIMSLYLSLAPVFILSSVLLALARRPGAPAPGVSAACAGLFFVLGVMGLSAETGWAAAVGTGVLYILAGLPAASVVLALWRPPTLPAWRRESSTALHAG